MDIRFRRGALDDVVASRRGLDGLNEAAEGVQDRARRAARAVSSDLVDAIVATPAEVGPTGPEAKIGYDKSKPGFVLWWHEVGNRNHPATPHLRPAIRGRS